MRILFISSWFPYPPDNGSRIRAYNLIRALSRGHDVRLISLLQEDSNPADAARLAGICDVVSLHRSRWFKPGTLKSMAGFFSTRPRSYVDTFDPAVREAVEGAIGEVSPDVVVASQLCAMAYVPERCSVPVVFEEAEIGSMYRRLETGPASKRFRAGLTFAKHRALVGDLLRRADVYTCVSDQELHLIERCCPGASRGVVVPNGVAVGEFDPDDRAPEPDTLIYNGAPTYSANLDAVRFYVSEIYPILAESRPGIRLRVTGRTDGVDLHGIESCPGIEFTGYVEDIRTVLRRSAACVVPLREGGGSRLKILEAMAAGVPVVSTSLGVEGIDAEHGRRLVIADDPSEFADAVISLLSDRELAGRLSREARKLVEERYDWSMIGERFVDVVTSAARRSRGRQ